MALKCLAADLTDCEVILRVDNTTTVAYVNKIGGTRHPHLNQITKDIWKWCKESGLWILTSYIKSFD